MSSHGSEALRRLHSELVMSVEQARQSTLDEQGWRMEMDVRVDE